MVWSSSNFSSGNSGYQRYLGYNIWRSELIREFSTTSFDKYRQFSPIATKYYVWRPSSLFRIQHHYASVASKEQKSRKMLLYLTALVFAMVGCSYAAVPLYRRFCQATGYGGTVQRREVCWLNLVWGSIFFLLTSMYEQIQSHTCILIAPMLCAYWVIVLHSNTADPTTKQEHFWEMLAACKTLFRIFECLTHHLKSLIQ